MKDKESGRKSTRPGRKKPGPKVDTLAEEILAFACLTLKSMVHGEQDIAVDPDKTIEQNGCDYLDIIELCIEIEDKYGIEEELNRQESVADMTVRQIAQAARRLVKAK